MSKKNIRKPNGNVRRSSYSKKSRMWARVIALGLVLFMLVASLSALLTGCGSTGANADDQNVNLSISVDVMNPKRGDLFLQNDFVGTVTPEDLVTVMPMVAGTVVEANFQVGDFVNAGDVLFRIDDVAPRLQLAGAQLGAASASLQAASQLGAQHELQLLQQQAAIDQINNSIRSSTVGLNQARQSMDNIESQQSTLRSQKEKLEEQMGEMDAKISQLNKAIKAASASINTVEVSEDEFYQFTEGNLFHGNIIVKRIETPNPMHEQDPSAPEYIFSFVVQPEADYDTVQSASAAVGTLNSTYSSLNASRENLDSTIKNLDTSKDSAAYNINSIYGTLDYLEESKKSTEISNAIQNTEILETTKQSLELQKQSSGIAVEQAELALSYYTIKAPISGYIESKNVAVNGMASQGYAAYTLANKDSMKVTFYVSEDVRNTLNVGDDVTIMRGEKEYQGVITEAENSVDMQTGLFKIKAAANVTGDILSNGVSVTVKATTYSAKNVMLIPYSAVYYEDGVPYVYVAQGSQAVKTYIETGIFDDDLIVVESGIDNDTQVIVTWSPKLTNGVDITATMVEQED